MTQQSWTLIHHHIGNSDSQWPYEWCIEHKDFSVTQKIKMHKWLLDNHETMNLFHIQFAGNNKIRVFFSDSNIASLFALFFQGE